VGITDATAVRSGTGFRCALLRDGTIRCWGYNGIGELGSAATVPYSSLPVAADSITDAVDVATGDLHACAALKSGQVRCWGAGDLGTLGNGGTTQDSFTPTRVRDISTAVAVAAGDSHSCALLGDGTVQCWGSNLAGQLGNGTSNAVPSTSLVPITIVGP